MTACFSPGCFGEIVVALSTRSSLSEREHFLNVFLKRRTSERHLRHRKPAWTQIQFTQADDEEAKEACSLHTQ